MGKEKNLNRKILNKKNNKVEDRIIIEELDNEELDNEEHNDEEHSDNIELNNLDQSLSRTSENPEQQTKANSFTNVAKKIATTVTNSLKETIRKSKEAQEEARKKAEEELKSQKEALQEKNRLLAEHKEIIEIAEKILKEIYKFNEDFIKIIALDLDLGLDSDKIKNKLKDTNAETTFDDIVKECDKIRLITRKSLAELSKLTETNQGTEFEIFQEKVSKQKKALQEQETAWETIKNRVDETLTEEEKEAIKNSLTANDNLPGVLLKKNNDLIQKATSLETPIDMLNKKLAFSVINIDSPERENEWQNQLNGISKKIADIKKQSRGYVKEMNKLVDSKQTIEDAQKKDEITTHTTDNTKNLENVEKELKKVQVGILHAELSQKLNLLMLRNKSLPSTLEIKPEITNIENSLHEFNNLSNPNANVTLSGIDYEFDKIKEEIEKTENKIKTLTNSVILEADGKFDERYRNNAESFNNYFNIMQVTGKDIPPGETLKQYQDAWTKTIKKLEAYIIFLDKDRVYQNKLFEINILEKIKLLKNIDDRLSQPSANKKKLEEDKKNTKAEIEKIKESNLKETKDASVNKTEAQKAIGYFKSAIEIAKNFADNRNETASVFRDQALHHGHEVSYIPIPQLENGSPATKQQAAEHFINQHFAKKGSDDRNNAVTTLKQKRTHSALFKIGEPVCVTIKLPEPTQSKDQGFSLFASKSIKKEVKAVVYNATDTDNGAGRVTFLDDLNKLKGDALSIAIASYVSLAISAFSKQAELSGETPVRVLEINEPSKGLSKKVRELIEIHCLINNYSCEFSHSHPSEKILTSRVLEEKAILARNKFGVNGEILNPTEIAKAKEESSAASKTSDEINQAVQEATKNVREDLKKQGINPKVTYSVTRDDFVRSMQELNVQPLPSASQANSTPSTQTNTTPNNAGKNVPTSTPTSSNVNPTPTPSINIPTKITPNSTPVTTPPTSGSSSPSSSQVFSSDQLNTSDGAVPVPNPSGAGSSSTDPLNPSDDIYDPKEEPNTPESNQNDPTLSPSPRSGFGS